MTVILIPYSSYVPDGLTPAQYKAIKAKEEAAAKKNKQTARKGCVRFTDTFLYVETLFHAFFMYLITPLRTYIYYD